MKKFDVKYLVQVISLREALNRVYFAKNTGFSAVRLFFLKYITDNFIGATTKDEVQYYANVQKMFAARDVDGGPNALVPILRIIDSYYNLNGLVVNSINEYAKELFGLDDSWNRKNTTSKDCREIMERLSEIDFAESSSSNEKGRQLVSSLLEGMQEASEGNRLMYGYITKSEVAEIVKQILKVKEGETFLDFVAGTGTSTILAIDDQECNIINADVNNESLAIAAMLYIMKGYRHFEMQSTDSLGQGLHNVRADKIFADPPLGVKIQSAKYPGMNVDTTTAAIETALQCLSENGTAIIAVPSGVLFGASKRQILIKKEIVDRGYLKAVIALPISWFGTAITINLMVLSNSQNKEVLFINACGNAFSDHVQKVKNRHIKIDKAGIQMIVNAVDDNGIVLGFSNVIDSQTIAQKNYNLMPATYIKQELEEESVSIEEIDSELAKLYAEIGLNNKF